MLEVLRRIGLLLLLANTPVSATSSEDATGPETLEITRPVYGRPSTSSVLPLSSSASPRASNSTCISGTVNYITHTLPQQCLPTNRRTANVTLSLNSTASATSSAPEATTKPVASEANTKQPSVLASPGGNATDEGDTSSTESTGTNFTAVTSSSATLTVNEPITSEAPGTTEEDPSFDSAAFLSFEEWKKQNLAKTGQSPDNVGRESSQNGSRHRPDIHNALDALGDDTEIDLDFAGFGNAATAAGSRDTATVDSPGSTGPPADTRPATAAGQLRSRDAGKTCKERTNHASIDCSASMMKNNKECKNPSLILVESKDSYMLNVCSADNKFVIVELCTDIHIDTIVLANYEFFSSNFRHFRVSVSDRYPAKPDKWRELGTFEARNTREVQAFLVEEPQIWARYLRIEFLTHYGSEYFCPVSLLRVHGRTMMQEFRHEEEMARGEISDDEPALEAQTIASMQPQVSLAVTDESVKGTVQVVSSVETSDVTIPSISEIQGSASVQTSAELEPSSPRSVESHANATQLVTPAIAEETCASPASTVGTAIDSSPTATTPSSLPSSGDTSVADLSTRHTSSTSIMPAITETVSLSAEALASTNDRLSHTTIIGNSTSTQATSVPSESSVASSLLNSTSTDRPESDSSLAKPSNTGLSSSPNSSRTTPSASPTPQASTQESIFKSFSKRLSYLEGNMSDGMRYTEEQSRGVRDAFKKLEQRQIAQTKAFLSSLNDTVMAELHGFQQAYDQLYQGTVIEIEGQKQQTQRELLALSSRLTLITDELVWQKRMGIVQSTLLLTCLGLVLFGRQGSTYVDSTLAQQLMSRSQAAIRAGWESDPNSPSPTSRSPVSVFRRKLWRSSTGPPNGALSEGTESRPQTRDDDLGLQKELPTLPVDEDEQESDDDESQIGSEGLSRTQSSPPAPDRGLKRLPNSREGSKPGTPLRDKA